MCKVYGCRTWKEEFSEGDHLHESKSYDGRLRVVTVLHSVGETCPERHHVLPTVKTRKLQSHSVAW